MPKTYKRIKRQYVCVFELKTTLVKRKKKERQRRLNVKEKEERDKVGIIKQTAVKAP